MGIGLTHEERALAESVRDWCTRTSSRQGARDLLEKPAAVLPSRWSELADLGLLAVHLPEEVGGGGGTPTDLAVVAEELARGSATGAFSATAIAGLVLRGLAGMDRAWLAGLASGAVVAGIPAEWADVSVVSGPGGRRLSGSLAAVLAGAVATHLLIPVVVDGVEGLAVVDTRAAGVDVKPAPGLAPWAQLAEVTLSDVTAVDEITGVSVGAVRGALVTVLAAEAAGVAGWCLDTASEHARTRVQFGRTIGSFQAVKHLCAQMLVRTEQSRALAWDAAQAFVDGEQSDLAAAAAGSLVFDAAVDSAYDCIQILGGMGFTWDHDAHLQLRHALVLRQLAGQATTWRRELVDVVSAGARRTFGLDTSDQRPQTRAAASAVAQRVLAAPASARAILADAGYLATYWPQPWGRGADALDQLVIAEELAAAGVRVPGMLFEHWVLPTLIAHGTSEQKERFVGPTLRGEIAWCQLFSEPEAGSDLAGLRTAARRVDGGWSIDGQKVWTSMAQYAQWAICLARTNPAAPKHEGITYFLVDMSTPGVTVRPLRDISGEAHFNEVFLDGVFVPDDCVVGAVDGGWQLARNTLSNERVALTSGSTLGSGAEAVLTAATEVGRLADPVTADRVGAFLAAGQAQSVLGLRATLAQLSGTDPGPVSSVRKLLGMEHQQAATDFQYQLLGPAAAMQDGAGQSVAAMLLLGRSLTIAGGTTQVLHNVVAERILGLPRDEDR